MTRSVPATDPRRTAALRAVLERLAPALAPQWTGPRQSGTFGRAMVEIAARLAEETTRRLDQTPSRDTAAFFDELDISPSAPRAADATLVFALAEARQTPISAPARVRVAAAVDGDEVVFETLRALSLAPGRLADVFAVDPLKDRIEQAPGRVFATEAPPPVLPVYQVLSFAGAGSKTLQLTSVIGLAAGDLLRVGRTAHRIGEPKGELVPLVDPLEAPAPTGTVVTKIDALESFALRDLQAHVLYVGHAELFNLEQPARISLQLAPDSLARRLSGLDVTYCLWGTPYGEDEADWHELGQLGASGPILKLFKSWPGTVEEVEVNGQKSRWLRAELQQSIGRRAGLGARVSSLAVGVESVVAGDAGTREGSETISQALHNSVPLSVASRFFPFGPEPLRFDTFTLAAPEVLSKANARATIDVRLVDSSLTSLEIAVVDDGLIRAYGIGGKGHLGKGHLQALAFETADALRWQELGPPALPDDGGTVELNGDRGLHPVGISANSTLIDAVVVEDMDGRLWSGKIERDNIESAPFGKPVWTQLPPLTSATDGYCHLAVAPYPHTGTGKAPAVGAVLLVPAGGHLHALRLTTEGDQSDDEWREVATEGARPNLDVKCQLVTVQGPAWPTRPTESRLEILLVDADGAVYLGAVAADPETEDLTVCWELLDKAHKAALDVRPVATYFDYGAETPGLWVAWAREDSHHLQGWRRLAEERGPVDGPDDEDQPAVATGTALHADPRTLGGADGRRPVTVGLSGDPKARVALLWASDTEVRVAELPDGDTTPQIYLMTPADGPPPNVVVGAARERLFVGTVWHKTVQVELHDGVTWTSRLPAHFIEVFEPGPPRVHDLDRQDKITKGETRTYLISDEAGLAATQKYRLLRRIRERAVDLEGAVDPGQPSHLILVKDDKHTKKGRRVIITGQSYLVEVVEGGVARLDRDVALPSAGGDGTDGEDGTPGNPVDGANGSNGDEDADEVEVRYTPVIQLGEDSVHGADLGTLVRVTGEGVESEIPGLEFSGNTDPAKQLIVTSTEASAGARWVRLAQGWLTRPPDTGPAHIIGDLRVAVWKTQRLERGYQNPALSWEYFDGHGWRRLEEAFFDGTHNLATSGKVTFKVPDDLARTDIGGTDDFWVRARLVGGDYGRPRYIVTTTPPLSTSVTSVQTVTVDTSKLRPPEILSIEASFALDESVPAQLVLVENNRATLDQTQASRVAEATFDLFEGAWAIDPDLAQRALYLGFTQPIAVNPLDVYADVDEQPGEGALQADVLTPSGWRHITIEDETQSLRRRGMIRLFLNDDAVRARQFGVERYWIRLRPSPDAVADWAPVVRGLYPNAAVARQAKTIEQEILGSSLGEPDLTLQLSETPVLPDSLELRVRERPSDEETVALQAEHRRSSTRSGRLSDQPNVITRFDGAAGTWVLWRRVDSFVGQDGDARVYRLDPATGTVSFGDGRNGKIPPAGSDAVRAFLYQQGGGRQGNVKAWTELQTRSALESVDAVVLPVDAAGGIDAPGPEARFATAPDRLRHAGQALTPADFEGLATASSPDIVRARCSVPVGPNDPIRIAVAARNGSRCPIPTLAQREAIARYLAEAGWGALGQRSIEVVGPVYVRIELVVHLLARPDRTAEVEETATRALIDFLHPVDGGPDGTGWAFGRRPLPSDVLRALSTINDIDRVVSIDLRSRSAPALDALPPDGLICAEAGDIKVRATPGGGP
jgi:hypothetical protein